MQHTRDQFVVKHIYSQSSVNRMLLHDGGENSTWKVLPQGNEVQLEQLVDYLTYKAMSQ